MSPGKCQPSCLSLNVVTLTIVGHFVRGFNVLNQTSMYYLETFELDDRAPGLILCMCPANERRRYTVTPSLIGWAQTQNNPWGSVTPSSQCQWGFPAIDPLFPPICYHYSSNECLIHFHFPWHIFSWSQWAGEIWMQSLVKPRSWRTPEPYFLCVITSILGLGCCLSSIWWV